MEDYKLRHPYYKPKLSEWVERRTWIQLSERKLKPADRTDGTRPNDKTVEDLLRLRGNYALDSTDADKVSYAAPHEEFERIVWPDPLTTGTSYLRAFEVYLDLWRTLKLTMPRSELPSQKLLCNIMEGAMKPSGLKANPFGQPGAEPWRRTAHKDVNNLIDLIHENADQMDQYKKRPLSERRHVGKLSTTTTTCEHDGCTSTPEQRADGSGHYNLCRVHRQLTSGVPLTCPVVASPTMQLTETQICKRKGCNKPRYVGKDGKMAPCCSL